jgi:APA family basic amino acid/polyamine antiporter
VTDDGARVGEAFERALGPWSATAIVAGAMIGTGIFFFVSPVAELLHGATQILFAWLAGALVATCGALCIAELAAAYPHTGGTYVYLRRAFGPMVAFVYSWVAFWIMRVGNLAIAALAFSTFTHQLLKTGMDPASYEGVALGLIVAVTAVNAFGVRFGGGLQTAMTALKIVCLAAILGVGAGFAAGALASHPIELQVSAFEDQPLVWRFALALIPVMWTLGGWDESAFVAEEIHEPERNLPLSVMTGLWTVALLYVAVNGAYLAILTPAEMAATGERTAVLAMQRALGPGAQRALSFALMLSTAGMANGMVMTGARLAYATGRDQRIFQWFASTNARTKTPVRALVSQAFLVAVVIIAVPDPFAILLYTGLAYWTFAGLMAAALVALRIQDRERRRPFRVWAYPWTPLVFIVASAGMAASVIAESTANAVATVVIMATGVAAFALQRRGRQA